MLQSANIIKSSVLHLADVENEYIWLNFVFIIKLFVVERTFIAKDSNDCNKTQISKTVHLAGVLYVDVLHSAFYKCVSNW